MMADKGVGRDETVSHVVLGRSSCRTDDGAATVAARSPNRHPVTQSAAPGYPTRRTRSRNPPHPVENPFASSTPLYQVIPTHTTLSTEHVHGRGYKLDAGVEHAGGERVEVVGEEAHGATLDISVRGVGRDGT